jgi:chromosome segregation ATPase
MLLALAVAAGLGGTACGKTESPPQKATIADVKKEAKELATSAGDLARQTKEAFVANAEQELADMNGKIRDLKLQAEKAQGDAKARLDRSVEQLERQRQTATETLKEIKDASGDAWKDMTSGFTAAWEEMKKGYDAAKES